MKIADYRKAFLELAEFRRSYLGDIVWLNDYLASRAEVGREEITIPKGVYYIDQPIQVPMHRGPLCIKGESAKFVREA